MKRYIVSLLAALVILGGCQRRFEEKWDLALDREAVVVPADKDRIPLTIYCSGDWTVRFTTGGEWASLDRTSGSGVTTIHILFSVNPGLSRTAELEVRSADKVKTVSITQRPGIKLPQLIFEKSRVALPGGSFTRRSAVDTNIPEDYFDSESARINYVEGGEGWLSGLSWFRTEEPSPESVGLPDGVRCYLFWTAQANPTEVVRKAWLVVSTRGNDAEVYKDSVLVTQDFTAPYVSVAVTSDLVPRDGAQRSWRVDTNLGDAIEDLVVSVSYSGSATGFIEDLSFENGLLNYTVPANTSPARRYATVKLSCRDAGQAEIAASIAIEQKMEESKLVRMADVRTKFPSGGVWRDEPGDESYIEGLVIGGSGNPNMDQNLQYGTTIDGYDVTAVDTSATGARPNANNIYTTENDRTNYIEDLDGSGGFRLKFGRPLDNSVSRGDRTRIYLDGVKVIFESDPDRFTLGDVTRMDVISRNHDIPVKNRTVATLSDSDIYTWVTLSDMEFQIKRGAYANVREYDAIANPVNRGLAPGVNQARQAKDGAANLLYDKDGNGIYMLVNMNCDWRWDASAQMRKQVPQGTGSLSGILVHQQMDRWSDDIGRYSIRPVDESDIAIASSAASNWNDLVEWTFTKKTWSVGQYSWNTATSATGGYITSGKYTDAQVVQEVLNATTAAGMVNNTGAVARLYTDNLKMYQNQTGNSLTGYPVIPAWGYRGFNVSNPTVTAISNNTDQLFGMSAGSIIEFLVNYCGFYDWDGNNWTGGVNGIVAEFSTAGVSGSEAAVSFSIAGGMLNRSSANNISWQNAYSFPVDWAVEYATSEDGSSWSSWIRAVNAATGRTGFELRGVPFAVTDASSYASFHATVTTSPFYTNIDNGFGLTPYRFILPSSVLDKAGVKVRLVPTSLRMAAWNVGSGNWYKGLCYRNEIITETFEIPMPCNTAICIEDVLIQYK
ncbi:MAG: BACON domain-containing protein [Bacteroidales bacterium]|nr:BACON domain-containing protein [Bacteroidales bacterium]